MQHVLHNSRKEKKKKGKSFKGQGQRLARSSQNVICTNGREMLLLWKTKPKSPYCCHKNKPKSEWAINKMPEIIQAQSMVTASSTISQDDTTSITMQPVQMSINTNVVHATSPFQWMAVQLRGVAMSQV